MPQAGLQPPQQAAASSADRAASPPRQPRAARPPPPLPPPPPTAPDGACPGSPASPLPPHLQHAMHRALSDLQAQRLLYPQQCAAAEQAASGERQEANSRALAALGGTSFDYSAAAAELDEARRSAKQLLSLRRGAGAGAGSIGASRAAAPAAAAAESAAASSGAVAEEAEGEQALWSSYEALSAAVAAEVDRRIATVRLHPAPAPSRSPTRQPRTRLAAPEASKPPAAAPDSSTGSRRPLGSLQHSVPAAPAAERKRGRSPHERFATGRPKALVQPAAAAVGANPQAASPPSSKRLRPHVAFGTRCDAPRPTAGARGGKAVQLDASAAPTPPQLPPAHPAEPAAARQPARRDPLPSSALSAAAAAPAPRSDLLRSLAASFAGGSSSRAQRSSGLQPAEASAAAAQEGRDSSSGGGEEGGQMQQMLADLTAALQGMSLPADGAAVPAADGSGSTGSDSGPSLQSTLQLHGLGDAAAAQDASALLQAVLDRMDAIALRTQSPEPGPSAGASPPPAGVSPGAEQLCSQLDRLVDAGSIELRALQQEVAVVRQAEAAAERINAAAVGAALAGAEAAAAAAAAAARRASSPRPAALHMRAAAYQEASPIPGPDAASPLLALQAPAATADSPGAAPASELARAAGPEFTAAADGRSGSNTATGEPQAAQPPPADGWPVQWPAAAPALGVPLLWPPGQSQWLAPGTFNPAIWHAALPPAPTPALGHPCAWQPAPQEPQQAQPSREWPGNGWQAGGGQALSVALRDEQLPGSPESEASAPSSPVSPSGGGSMGKPWPDAANVAEQQQEAEGVQGAQPEEEGRQQALLDAAAERAIQLYQQHRDPEQHAMAAAADAACAWDVAMRARGGAWGAAAAGDVGPTDEPPGAAPGEVWEEPACLPDAGDPAPAPASAQQLPVSVATAVTLQALAPTVAAPLPPPRAHPAPAPYNPLRAAAERAAAARLAEEAAGWRRLRQRADELALWHEYAAALGLEGEPAAAQGPAAGPALQLGSPPASAAPSAFDGPGASALRQASYPAPVVERHRLWRPCVPALPPAPPNVELSPLPSSSAGGASSGSSSGGTPAGSSLLSSEASSSCVATESSTSSLGMGARHKARALRYRLLRRRLEAAAAAGVRLPPLADDPSEGCLTPLSDASLSTPSARPPSSWGGELESAPEWTPAAPAAGQVPPVVGRLWDAGEPERQAARQPPSAKAAGAQPSPPVARRSDEATTCAAVTTCTLPGGLGDHLSDASTPASSCSSLAPAMAAAAVGRGRLLSGSSCSTLQEVAVARR